MNNLLGPGDGKGATHGRVRMVDPSRLQASIPATLASVIVAISGSDSSTRSVFGDRPWAMVVHDPLPIGLVALALMGGTSILLDVAPDAALLLGAFCGTSLVYGADRVLSRSPEDRVNRPGRVAWRRGHRGILWVEGLLLVVGLTYALIHLRWGTIGAAAVLGSIGGLHTVPALPGGRRLKAVGTAKPVIITIAWTLGAVLLPLIEAGAPFGVGAAWFSGYRFVFVLPNILLADWADREGDAAAGLNPWAAGWSGRSVRLLCTALLGSGIAGAGVAVYGFEASPLLLVDAAGYGVMTGAVWMLRPERSSVHAFVLDLLVGWPALTWLVYALSAA